MDKKFPRRKSPRLKDFDYSTSYTYFLTTRTKDKATIFTDDVLNNEITSCMKSQRERLGFKVFCYCLMPEHLHLLLTPQDSGHTVLQFMNGFKSLSTKICWKYGIKGRVWQSSFYDHILRRDEDILTVVEYIVNNPVRRGMVAHRRDYKYCGLLDM